MSKDDLNNMGLIEILPRIPYNIRKAIENNEAYDNLIHPEPNIFGKLRYKIIINL